MGMAELWTHFPKAELALAALAPVSISESDETYLLTSTDLNVKIRDSLLDVKALKKADRDGLEQWSPVLKTTFPLAPETATKVIALAAYSEP